MNNQPWKKFVVTAEVVVTTEQDIDVTDVDTFFKWELVDSWEARHDLDFESLHVQRVVEVDADPEAYAS